MEAVILAGGRGKRLGRLTKNTPKPLIKIGGKPIIEHQILALKRYGIKTIHVLSGYLGYQIKDYLRDGKRFKLKIEHIIENKPLGTAGALKQLDGKLKNDFILLSGDIIFDIDFTRFIKFHKKHKSSIATIAVHPNDHPFDSDLIQINEKGLVSDLILRKNKKHSKSIIFNNLANAGISIISPKIFNHITKKGIVDLEKDIFPKILKSCGIFVAYKTPEYIKDIGNKQRLAQASKDLKSGKVQMFNFRNKRCAIFLDRDGTINETGGIAGVKVSDLEIFPFIPRVIKKINDHGFLVIIISNQAAIAKGFLTFDDVANVHKKLEARLGLVGAKIDGIYFCPHYPEKGFDGEVMSLKKICSCRKPKIGLIKKAASDFNIDLRKSFFVGDTTIDAKTAENAGLKFIGVSTGHALKDNNYKIKSGVKIVKNLSHAIGIIAKIKNY